MSQAMLDWLGDEGLSTFSDLAQIGGRYVDYRHQQARTEDAARVGRFNRQLDLLNLALSREHNRLSQDITKQRATESLADVAQAEAEAAASDAEARLAATRRAYAQWSTGSQVAELERVAYADLQVAFARYGVETATLAAAEGVRGAERTLLATRRTGQRTREAAAGGALTARRGQQQVARGILPARTAAARATVGAGQRRLGGQRAVAALGGRFRIEAREAQAGREIGAAAVSGAARGIRGSFQETARAMAQGEAARDIALFRLEDGLRQLELGEQEAKLAAAGVDVEARHLEEVARLGVAGAEVSEAQARLLTGGREARAAFDVEARRQEGAGGVAAAQAGLLGEQRGALEGRRWLNEEQKARVKREGAVEQAGLSLQEARAKLGAGAARRTAAKAGIAAQERTYEVQLQSQAQQVMDWQLKHLPDLPDYEAMGTRNALSMIARTAADLAED